MAHDGNWKKIHRDLTEGPRWDSLALDGIQGAGGRALIEQRRCPDCGSTLSRPVSVDRASEIISRQSEILSVSLAAIATAVGTRRRRLMSAAAAIPPR